MKKKEHGKSKQLKLNICDIKEVKTGLLSLENVTDLFSNCSDLACICHSRNPMLLGSRALLKVNTIVGVSDDSQFDTEIKKVRAIAHLTYAPDSMMDLSFASLKNPLWKYMVKELDIPVGVLPHYSVFNQEKGIDKNALMEIIDEMGSYGVNFMTLHLTSVLNLLETAHSCRKIPTTARGGWITLKDAIINKRKVNIFVDNFDEILQLFLKYNMTLSVGTTFRPARISEALDAVQMEEIKLQSEYITYAKEKGVNVIMEGVGHLPLSRIQEYCSCIKPINTPLMTLGPIPTDATIGFDHVSSAIGATVIAMYGNLGVINSITREEHTGKIPSEDSIIEGLKSARVVAHSINLMRFEKYKAIDNAIADNRELSKTCVVNGGIFNVTIDIPTREGCDRCRHMCPLTALY
jgi:phosphomethylpyrimidine synthase